MKRWIWVLAITPLLLHCERKVQHRQVPNVASNMNAPEKLEVETYEVRLLTGERIVVFEVQEMQTRCFIHQDSGGHESISCVRMEADDDGND